MQIACILMMLTGAVPAPADERSAAEVDRYYDGESDRPQAGLPYNYYPPQYYIFSGHPSRYYYSYPDRYYARRYRAQDFYRPWRPDAYWRYLPEGNYGYREPYRQRGR